MFRKSLFFVYLVIFLSLFGCKEKISVTSLSGLPESSEIKRAKESLIEKRPIVITYTASWCPHCQRYKPVFFEVEKDYIDKVTFINIDIDDKENSKATERFQVKGVPTTAFIRQDGSIFKIESGHIEKENLKTITEDLIKNKEKNKNEPVAPFPIENSNNLESEKEAN